MDVLTEKECSRLWPGARVGSVVDLEREDAEDTSVAAVADKMMAATFYAELAEPASWVQAPAALKIVIRCRVPPGPFLTELASRWQAQRIRLSVSQDGGPPACHLLCTVSVLADVKRDKVFRRELKMLTDSPAAVADLRVTGLQGTGWAAINNSQCSLGSLEITTQDEGHGTLETGLRMLETELAGSV